jgi:hypothetical protein
VTSTRLATDIRPHGGEDGSEAATSTALAVSTTPAVTQQRHPRQQSLPPGTCLTLSLSRLTDWWHEAAARDGGLYSTQILQRLRQTLCMRSARGGRRSGSSTTCRQKAWMVSQRLVDPAQPAAKPVQLRRPQRASPTSITNERCHEALPTSIANEHCQRGLPTSMPNERCQRA